MLNRVIIFCLICIASSSQLKAQSFYKEKNPKTIFYQIGLGAGTFYSAPRPSYDSIVNEKLPVLSVAVGKRMGSHLSLKSNFSFQPFSSKEYVISEEGNSSLEPIFNGYNYAVDITPTFNLLPNFHHVSRPIIDFNLGIGLGYLLTYRTEKFFFNEKYYEFNLFEHSVYIPVLTSLSFRLGKVSDLVIEGAFFNTFLDSNRGVTEIKKDSDHFGQLNFVYRRFIR